MTQHLNDVRSNTAYLIERVLEVIGECNKVSTQVRERSHIVAVIRNCYQIIDVLENLRLEAVRCGDEAAANALE